MRMVHDKPGCLTSLVLPLLVVAIISGCEKQSGHGQSQSSSTTQTSSATLQDVQDAEDLFAKFQAVGQEGTEETKRIEASNREVAQNLDGYVSRSLQAFRNHLGDKKVIWHVGGRPPETVGSFCANSLGYHHQNAFLKAVEPRLRGLDAESLIGLLAGSSRTELGAKPALDWSALMDEYKVNREGYTTSYVVRDGNKAVREELLRRGKAVLAVLHHYEKDRRDVFTGENGPWETVGSVCSDLVREIEAHSSGNK